MHFCTSIVYTHQMSSASFLYIDMIIYYIKGLNACRNQAKITNVKCVCFCTYVPLRVSSRAVNINVLVQSLAGFIPKVFAF